MAGTAGNFEAEAVARLERLRRQHDDFVIAPDHNRHLVTQVEATCDGFGQRVPWMLSSPQHRSAFAPGTGPCQSSKQDAIQRLSGPRRNCAESAQIGTPGPLMSLAPGRLMEASRQIPQRGSDRLSAGVRGSPVLAGPSAQGVAQPGYEDPGGRGFALPAPPDRALGRGGSGMTGSRAAGASGELDVRNSR